MMDFVLPEEITIKFIPGLKEALCELLGVQGENLIRIDASHLQRLDTLGYQLLLAFQLASGKANKFIEWSEPSEALLECNRLLGNRHTFFCQTGGKID